MERVDNLDITLEKYFKDGAAFTVTNPFDVSGSSSLGFKSAITNKNNEYNITTGIFKCNAQGLYHFSLHLVKKKGFSAYEIGCYIKVNRTNTVRAYFEPFDYSDYDGNEAERGSYGISTSVIVELVVDDQVSVGDCTPTSYNSATDMFESWSTFNGYLIRPYF